MSTLDERLAQARDEVRERKFVAKRLEDTRADRARVMQQLEVTKQLLANEQDDVDRLTKGVGGFFRKLTSSREDLTREQKELAAAKLQHEALEDELKAIEIDLTQLCEREARVVDAEQRYAAALREREAQAAKDGSPNTAHLAALSEHESKLHGLRKEVAEAIAAGREAHDLLAVIQQSAVSNNRAAYALDVGTSGFGLGFETRGSIAGDVGSAVIRDQLRGELGRAQHALLRFQRECRDVSPDSGVPGIELPRLPGIETLIARELVWTNHDVVDDIHAEVSLIATHVAQSVMDLRARDGQLQQALAQIGEQRASLLDPARERL